MHLYVLGTHLLLTYNTADVYSSTKAVFSNWVYASSPLYQQYLDLNMYD